MKERMKKGAALVTPGFCLADYFPARLVRELKEQARRSQAVHNPRFDKK